MKLQKNLINLKAPITFVLSIGLLSSSIALARGGSSTGGGDITCEARILAITADIKEWIEEDGPEKRELILPSNVSLHEYNRLMLDKIEDTSGNISCTSKIIKVDGVEKTCRQSRKKNSIECNFTRFNATSESDQYSLIHHEYAGMAGLEKNLGSQSDYSLSKQISGFLETVEVKKLAVRPKKQVPVKPSNNNINQKFVNGDGSITIINPRVLYAGEMIGVSQYFYYYNNVAARSVTAGFCVQQGFNTFIDGMSSRLKGVVNKVAFFHDNGKIKSVYPHVTEDSDRGMLYLTEVTCM